MATPNLLYRAVSAVERDDILLTGGLRPGPPSFQGKWFMGRVDHVAAMGRKLFAFDRDPFHIVEVAYVGDDEPYVEENCDRIGPAYFFDTDQLAGLRFVREIDSIPR